MDHLTRKVAAMTVTQRLDAEHAMKIRIKFGLDKVDLLGM